MDKQTKEKLRQLVSDFETDLTDSGVNLSAGDAISLYEDIKSFADRYAEGIQYEAEQKLDATTMGKVA